MARTMGPGAVPRAASSSRSSRAFPLASSTSIGSRRIIRS
jgi:hypothetical protein